ncbi:MAG: alpha/beta hydrolase [Planctomycetaceae bacterium]
MMIPKPYLLLLALVWCAVCPAREPDRVIELWPELAPGETTREVGAALPRREKEDPPATRIGGITQPRVMWYRPAGDAPPTGVVLILPGGGYNYVVADKEGSEVAEWLNSLGIAAGVVHYRTKRKEPGEQPLWVRPVQDGQRAIRLVRQHAAEWGVPADRVAVMGFSAGGNAAGLLATRFNNPAYEPLDGADEFSCRPDLCLLMYPWRLADESTGELNPEVTVTAETPQTFLVHAQDDSVTVFSSVAFFTALKRHKVPGELHVYARGGHGYGIRPVEDSEVDTWPARAEDWLRLQGWVRE